MGRWLAVRTGRLVKLCFGLYRMVVLPMLPTACKYYPSCSHYAEEAIERHGLRVGAALAAKRLARCHPLASGGFDPVPERSHP